MFEYATHLKDLGIGPTILLFSNRMEVSFGKELSSGGIVPVNCTHAGSYAENHMQCHWLYEVRFVSDHGLAIQLRGQAATLAWTTSL